MMANLSTAIAMGLCLIGCGTSYPDRRTADVVVDEGLATVTSNGIAWWADATNGDARLTLSMACNDEHSCVTIKVVDDLKSVMGGSDEDGLAVTDRWENSNGTNGAWIQVLSTVNKVLLPIIITHELGHSLELEHVTATTEVMRPSGNEPSACIGEETLAEYQQVYGIRGHVVCH